MLPNISSIHSWVQDECTFCGSNIAHKACILTQKAFIDIIDVLAPSNRVCRGRWIFLMILGSRSVRDFSMHCDTRAGKTGLRVGRLFLLLLLLRVLHCDWLRQTALIFVSGTSLIFFLGAPVHFSKTFESTQKLKPSKCSDRLPSTRYLISKSFLAGADWYLWSENGNICHGWCSRTATQRPACPKMRHGAPRASFSTTLFSPS